MPQKKENERLGFLRTDSDVSYFIIYVMTLLPGPISYPALLDICLIDEAFGYFEFKPQFDRLVEQGIIFEDTSNTPPLYFATNICHENQEAVKEALPLSVCDKAKEAVLRVVNRHKRDSDISTNYVENIDGSYNVTLEIHSAQAVIFKIELMLTGKNNVDIAINNFRKNAEYYYREYSNGLLDFSEKEEI